MRQLEFDFDRIEAPKRQRLFDFKVQPKYTSMNDPAFLADLDLALSDPNSKPGRRLRACLDRRVAAREALEQVLSPPDDGGYFDHTTVIGANAA